MITHTLQHVYDLKPPQYYFGYRFGSTSLPYWTISKKSVADFFKCLKQSQDGPAWQWGKPKT